MRQKAITVALMVLANLLESDGAKAEMLIGSPASGDSATSQSVPSTLGAEAVNPFRKIKFNPPNLQILGIPISGSSPMHPPNIPGRPVLLVPDQSLGLTTGSHPVFFAYMPKAGLSEFVITEAGSAEAIYSVKFVTKAPGIVRVALPGSSPALMNGKTYWWYFAQVDNPKQWRDATYVQGLIQHVEPSVALKKELSQATPGEVPAIFANAGIWQDTLMTLAALRENYPHDVRLSIAWTNLLTSVGLESVATASFTDTEAPNPTSSPSAIPLSAPTESSPNSREGSRGPGYRPPSIRLPGRPASGGSR